MPGFIADRRDNLVAPETGPILSNPPAFTFRASRDDRGAELLFRCATTLIVGGEKHPEVLPDDLLGGIPLDPLGLPRPARDDAVGVEQEDRVVADVLDQEPVSLLGLTQRLGRPMLHTDVVHHFGKGLDVPPIVPNRGDDPVGRKAGAILPDMHPLVVRAPGRPRTFQLLRGLVPDDIVWCKDRRKGKADELLGIGSQHQLHAGIPRCDGA